MEHNIPAKLRGRAKRVATFILRNFQRRCDEDIGANEADQVCKKKAYFPFEIKQSKEDPSKCEYGPFRLNPNQYWGEFVSQKVVQDYRGVGLLTLPVRNNYNSTRFYPVVKIVWRVDCKEANCLKRKTVRTYFMPDGSLWICNEAPTHKPNCKLYESESESESDE